jgi:hypothetical protein
MAEVTHLPSNCSTDDIIDILERDGAAIVDGFVDDSWLSDFNTAVQTSVDSYTPYDYCEPEAMGFLGHQTVRLNGLAGKQPRHCTGMT